MSKATVLIVDDECLLLDIIATEAADAGFEVITATSPQEALEVLEGPTRVDVLFTDIRMPGVIDGWELGIRAKKIRSNLPVLYATGYSKGIPEGLTKGSLFVKPYNVEAVITAFLKAASSARI